MISEKERTAKNYWAMHQHFKFYRCTLLTMLVCARGIMSCGASTAGSQKLEPSHLLLCRKIATVTKPAVRILCCHREQRLTNGFLQGFARARSRSSQKSLHFRKGFFNRREIRGIGGQKEQLTASALDQFLHLLAFMGCQVVHDHDLPWG